MMLQLRVKRNTVEFLIKNSVCPDKLEARTTVFIISSGHNGGRWPTLVLQGAVLGSSSWWRTETTNALFDPLLNIHRPLQDLCFSNRIISEAMSMQPLWATRDLCHGVQE